MSAKRRYIHKQFQITATAYEDNCNGKVSIYSFCASLLD